MTHEEAMEHEFHLTLTGRDLSTILYALGFCARELKNKVVNGYADGETVSLLNGCIDISYRIDEQYIKGLEEAEAK